MANIQLGDGVAVWSRLTGEVHLKAVVHRRAVGMPAQRDNTAAGNGKRDGLVDGAAAGLPEYSAARTLAVVDNESVKRALSVSGTGEGEQRVGVRCTDYQRGVGVVAVITKGATIIENVHNTCPDGVSAGGGHEVTAGVNRDRSNPPALFGAAIGTDKEVVGCAGSEIGEVVNSVENRDDVVHHSVGIHACGAIAEFIGARRSSVAPSHAHSVNRRECEVEVGRCGAAGLAKAMHIDLEAVINHRAVAVPHNGKRTLERGEGAEVLGGRDTIVVPHLSAASAKTVVDADIVISALRVRST